MLVESRPVKTDVASGLLVHDWCECWDMDEVPPKLQLAMCGSPILGIDANDEATDCPVCPEIVACARCGTTHRTI